jgi:hypothetical protein
MTIDGKINIYADFNNAFVYSCANGHLEVAKWLMTIDRDIAHGVGSGWAGPYSCRNGHLEVVKWLWVHTNGFHLNGDRTHEFKYACAGYQTEIIKFLMNRVRFNNDLVDNCLPESLYEYAFVMGYLPVKNMVSAYEKYKMKVLEEIRVKNGCGDVTIFEIKGIPELIGAYVFA